MYTSRKRLWTIAIYFLFISLFFSEPQFEKIGLENNRFTYAFYGFEL